MEQNNKSATWQQAEQEIAEKINKPQTKHLALEILEQEHRVSKAKDLGVIGLTVAVIVIAIGLSIINYKNDCDWREFFSENHTGITKDINLNCNGEDKK